MTLELFVIDSIDVTIYTLMWMIQRKRNRQKGSAALETVLILIPLMTILLAIIDFSLAIFVMDTLEYAARQGCRYAITGNVATGLNQDASIRQVVRNNSMGFLSNTDTVPDANITINYYTLNSATNTWTATASNANGNMVEVGVSAFSWAWIVPGWWGTDGAGHSEWKSLGPLSINAASADISQACLPSGCPTR